MNPYENIDCMLNDLYEQDENKIPHIANTARDYDMKYHEVESIWKKWGNNSALYYHKLEEFIKQRANR